MRLFLEDHELSREIREILHVLENFGLHISELNNRRQNHRLFLFTTAAQGY